MASIGALTLSNRGGLRMFHQARNKKTGSSSSRGRISKPSSTSSTSFSSSSTKSAQKHTPLHSQVSASSAQCPHHSVQIPGADVCLLSLRGHAARRAPSSLMTKGSRRALVESAPASMAAAAAAASVGVEANGCSFCASTALVALFGLGAGLLSVMDQYSAESTTKELRLKSQYPAHSSPHSNLNAALLRERRVPSAIAMSHPRSLPKVHVPDPNATDPHVAAVKPNAPLSLIHSEIPAMEVHPVHSSKAGNTLSPIRRRNARSIRREAIEFTEEALAAKPLLPYSEAPKKATVKELQIKKSFAEVVRKFAATEGAEVSVRALRGRRLQMEDEYTICNNGKFVAVFDGHGGSGVARYLRQSLYARILYYLGKVHEGDQTRDLTDSVPIATSASLSEEENEAMSAKQHTLRFLNFLKRMRQANTSQDVKVDADLAKQMNALQSAFRSIELDVLMNDRFHYQGSTAVVCMVHEHEQTTAAQSASVSSPNAKSLIVANIGDSRAVLSRKGEAVCLTKDHKPNAAGERSRLTALGESIEFDGFVHRVRNLSLSRAIGDRHAKPAVSSEVDIIKHTVDPQKDEFVILASDGLWDVMSNQEAVSFVHEKLGKTLNQDLPPELRVKDPTEHDAEDDKKLVQKWKRKQMSRFLANEAMKLGTMDNVCVAVVWLNEDVRRNESDVSAHPKPEANK